MIAAITPLRHFFRHYFAFDDDAFAAIIDAAS